MPRRVRVRYLADVDLLATAVERACRAADPGFRRINIDILGNTDALVHAHIWPRYDWEPPDRVNRPVWLYEPANGRDSATAFGAPRDTLRASTVGHLRALIDEDSIRITG